MIDADILVIQETVRNESGNVETYRVALPVDVAMI